MSEAVMDSPPDGVEVFKIPDDYELEGDFEEGWYYWYCQPGCLPDGDPSGPFESEALAIEAAWEVEREADAEADAASEEADKQEEKDANEQASEED